MVDVSKTYSITLTGSGVDEADAIAAFEDCVTALRTATAEGGDEPSGSFTHTQGTTELAVDVAP